MTDYLSLTSHGVAKYVASGVPTASIVGAQLDDLYVDSATGINYRCVDATFGSQQWLGSDGNTLPFPITSFSHPNLIAMYTMDNIAGATLVDETASSNDGTITGAVTVAGHIGNALRFSLGDIVILSNYSTAQGAVSFWLDTDAISASYVLVSTDPTKDHTYFFVAVRATGEVVISGNDTPITYFQLESNTFGNSSGYSHYVVQSNGTATQIFIDNVESTVQVAAGTDTGLWFSSPAVTEMAIGKTKRSLADFDGAGDVDQLRVFDRTLTADERTALYNSGAGA